MSDEEQYQEEIDRIVNQRDIARKELRKIVSQRDRLLAMAKEMPSWIAGEWAYDMGKLAEELELAK